MTDNLERVVETAKKLRKAAKKVADADIQNLILELSLHVADLKMQLVEMREEDLRQREQGSPPSSQQRSSSSSSQASSSSPQREPTPAGSWS